MSEILNKELVEEMFRAGVHLGYTKTRRHPSVSKHIFATKNKVDIINIEKTIESLEKAESFLKELTAKGKIVLFVGVKPEAKEIVKEVAQSLGMPYVTERFVGGMLTNFPEIKKRIDRLSLLKTQKENGELEKFTKKERMLIDEEIVKMHNLFFGLDVMKKVPDALFVVDVKKEYIAIAEAQKLHIPVIALTGTDTNIKDIDFPILANDSSITCIRFILDRIQKIIRSNTIKTQ